MHLTTSVLWMYLGLFTDHIRASIIDLTSYSSALNHDHIT